MTTPTMTTPPIATDERPAPEAFQHHVRFGMRELLTATLLSSIAFASQPVVGWQTAVCMTCAALAIVMGWGTIALAGSIAALVMACEQPNTVSATIACAAILLTIAFGPLAVHKLGRLFRS